MNFNTQRMKQLKIESNLDKMRKGIGKSGWDKSKIVKVSKETYSLYRPAMAGDIFGILAPSGVGKTTFVLREMMYTIKNHLETGEDGICVFFALEQDSSELIEKWSMLTEDEDDEISSRMYIFSNFDEDQIDKEPMSIADMELKLTLLREALGDVRVLSICLDHIHLTRHNHSDFNPVVTEFKRMIKRVGCLGYLVSQTQKANQIADVPPPRTGSYNCSKFEWDCTNIISLFQPLYRVAGESGLNFLGYQYCKIRYKNENDKTKEGMNYLLHFDHDTQNLRELTVGEKSEFALWYEKVLELRQNEEKYKSFQFDLSTTIKGKDGKEVVINNIVGGEGKD